MRIAYFADIRFPLERANGIQTMETCHALAIRGHRVDLIVRDDTQKPQRDPFAFYGLAANSALRFERAPASGPAAARRVAYLSFAAGRAVGRTRADVLFTRDLGVASMLLRIPAALRAPVVYESHGYAPEVAQALPELVSTATPPTERKLRRLEAREARVWAVADGYIAITQHLANAVSERFGARDRLAVVPDGVRIDPHRRWIPPPVNPGGSGRPLVAYAGHLYAWKGVDVLIHALARAPGVDGLIIGGHEKEPDLDRVKALATSLGVSGRLTFTGHVAPPLVADLLQRATIVVVPNPASAISTRFTSPLKLFEYMAAGRAIVASDLPAIREVLHDDVNALLVEPGNAAALAAGITRLASEPALASRLARAAFEAAPQYSWERRAERIEELLEQVRRARP